MSEAILSSLRDNAPAKDDRRILHFQNQGYLVIVGKNSFSNERIIIHHQTHPECLWLHAMAARGSHVILCSHGKPEPPESVIQFAAALAIRHSHSQARTVYVSLLRDVFKPEDSGIGIWKSSKFLSVEVPE